jgi:hypothetical protein
MASLKDLQRKVQSELSALAAESPAPTGVPSSMEDDASSSDPVAGAWEWRGVYDGIVADEDDLVIAVYEDEADAAFDQGRFPLTDCYRALSALSGRRGRLVIVAAFLGSPSSEGR